MTNNVTDEEDVDDIVYRGPHKWVYVDGSDAKAPRRMCSVCGAAQVYPTSDDPGPLTVCSADPNRVWLYPAEPTTCERKKVVIESVSGTCADLMEVTQLLEPAGYMVYNSVEETPEPPPPKKPTQAALLWAIERARNELESVKNLILSWFNLEAPLLFARVMLIKEAPTPRIQARYSDLELAVDAIKRAHDKLHQIEFRLERTSL